MSWITEQITMNDFKGEFKLPLTLSDSINFEEVCEDVTKKYMCKLLGIDLYEDFITGVQENTVLDKWSDLWDGVVYEYFVSKTNVEFVGCKKMCLYFIWAELKKYNTTATIEGDYQNTISNSTMAQVTNEKVIDMYNKGYVEFQNAKNFILSSIESGSTDYDGLMMESISKKILH